MSKAIKRQPSSASLFVQYLAPRLRHLFVILVFLSIVSLPGCTSTPSPTLLPPPSPVSRPNVLLIVTGTAQLKRDGWTDYTPVGFGTLLKSDDLLEVEGSVQILCGDLTLASLQSGIDSCPCPPAVGRLESGKTTYRGLPANVPTIEHPRNTLVLDDRPLLRWHDTDATSYTVAIVQGGEILWSQDAVVGHEVAYPAGAPSLQPNADYLLVVQDNDTGIQSSEDPTKGIGFRVMSEAQRRSLAAQCDKVAALSGLDDSARDYALALCYASWMPETGTRGVWGAAWLLLESVSETQEAPAVYLWMGDLLVKMRTGAGAEGAYRTALERAEALGDVESQAAAHAELWRLKPQDTAHRDEAIKLYGRLGDDDAADALRP